MSGDPASLVYTVLLLSAIVFWVVVQNRQSMSQVVQQALIWALIFVGAIAVVGLWDDIKQIVSPTQQVSFEDSRITIPRSADGHYRLMTEVNGKPLTFVVDTGASSIALSKADARTVGIDPDALAYTGTASTANGETRIAFVRLQSVSIAGMTDTNVRAWLNEGDLEQSLLGMSYLQRFSKIEITGNVLILQR